MGIWQAALKRDLTAEEETQYIKETAHECMMIMIELSVDYQNKCQKYELN